MSTVRLLAVLREKCRHLPQKKLNELEENTAYQVRDFVICNGRFGRYIVVKLEMCQVVLPKKWQEELSDEMVELLNADADHLLLRIKKFVSPNDGDIKISADILHKTKMVLSEVSAPSE